MENPKSFSQKGKREKGVFTLLGIPVRGFKNLYFHFSGNPPLGERALERGLGEHIFISVWPGAQGVLFPFYMGFPIKTGGRVSEKFLRFAIF